VVANVCLIIDQRYPRFCVIHERYCIFIVKSDKIRELIHQHINVPTVRAQAFLMYVHIRKTGDSPPRGPSVDWWVLNGQPRSLLYEGVPYLYNARYMEYCHIYNSLA
jgi:hypothetical protein